jgi:hypothetical protein
MCIHSFVTILTCIRKCVTESTIKLAICTWLSIDFQLPTSILSTRMLFLYKSEGSLTVTNIIDISRQVAIYFIQINYKSKAVFLFIYNETSCKINLRYENYVLSDFLTDG